MFQKSTLAQTLSLSVCLSFSVSMSPSLSVDLSSSCTFISMEAHGNCSSVILPATMLTAIMLMISHTENLKLYILSILSQLSQRVFITEIEND